MLSGRTRESLAAADKAIELSKRLGLTDEVLFARQVRGVALCELEGEAGLSALRDALDRALDSGRGMVISVAYNNLGHFRWLVESPRGGLESKREGMAFDKRRGLAGSARWTQMEMMWILFDLGEWDQMLAVNLRGAMLCCRAVLPAMIAQRRGTIINIGSVVTSRILAGSAAYTASKYGLLGFSRVLAEELRPHGVRVGILSAGATDTPLWDAVSSGPDRGLMLRPEQVAEAAVMMAALEPNATLEEVTLLPAGGVL